MESIETIKIERQLHESYEDYFVRLCERKQEYGLDYVTIAHLLNRENGNNFGECAYRKEYAAFNRGRIYERKKHLDGDALEYYKTAQIEKIKLRDERTALSKEFRERARYENKLETMERFLKELGREQYVFSNQNRICRDSSNDILVCVSDLHIGAEYNNCFGVYNTDVAAQRLSEYAEKIIETAELYKSQNCYISLLGDEISGNIHKTIAVSNSDDVIAQVIKSSQLIADFVYALAPHFAQVYVNGVGGNHSRIDTKKDSLTDERLDRLVLWYLDCKFAHMSNVTVYQNSESTTFGSFIIRGKKYICVHGDYDTPYEKKIEKLSLWLGYIPDYVLSGHKHNPALCTISNIGVIQSGSLCGSGDDFSIEHRLKGDASQTFCVCTQKGVECIFPVKFTI